MKRILQEILGFAIIFNAPLAILAGCLLAAGCTPKAYGPEGPPKDRFTVVTAESHAFGGYSRRVSVLRDTETGREWIIIVGSHNSETVAEITK